MLPNGSATNSRRTAKAARAIQESVSSTILLTLKDPRVKNVTVTRAEPSDDLRQAKIYISVMGDDKMQALTLRGLKAARGFLQAKVAERLQTKNTPILQFVIDPSVKRNFQVSQAFREMDLPVEEGEVEPEVSSAAAVDQYYNGDSDDGDSISDDLTNESTNEDGDDDGYESGESDNDRGIMDQANLKDSQLDDSPPGADAT